MFHTIGDEILPTPVEYTTRLMGFKQYLPRGPLPEGGVRKKDLVQVWTDPGGTRTLTLDSIKRVW